MSGTLDPQLRAAVFERDRWRCRFCGRTDAGIEAHHIVYRSHGGADEPDNLISLDRHCHNIAHGLVRGWPVQADLAGILVLLVDSPGRTGLALLRNERLSE